MKRYLIYMVTIFTIFLVPKVWNVEAIGLCDNKVIADYRELFSNINIYSDYTIVDGQPTFDVTITNIPRNVYVEDVTTGETYKYASFTTENELIIKGYKENQKLTYRFYMEAEGCYGQVMGSRYVTLPNYNENSNDPLCEGIEEFSLCQKWGASPVSYNDFVSKTNEYREKKRLQQEQKIKEKVDDSFKTKVLNFIVDYYIFLIGGIAVIVLLLVALKTWATEKNEFDFKV